MTWTAIEDSPTPKVEPIVDKEKCDCICTHLINIEEMLEKILSHYTAKETKEAKEPETPEEIVIGYHERQSVVK